MSVSSENREAFQKRYPEYYAKMAEEKEEKDWIVKFVDTKDNMKALVVETDTGVVRLNSMYRPKKEAETWASQYDFSHLQMNAILFGFGNGLFVREILKRLRDDARCFIYEQDFTIIRQVMQEQDITDILNDERVIFIFEIEENLLLGVLQAFISWSTIKHQLHCVHPGYEKLYPSEEKEFWQTLKRLKEIAVVSKNTDVYFAHLYIENFVKNMPYIKDSNYMRELFGIIDKTVPAIVVSAGPSLDHNIEELKKAKGKAVIIAVDTAVRHLERHGVHYDCMVTWDSEKPESYFLEAPGCIEKPLFCGICSNPKMLGFHTGRKIWLSKELLLTEIYEKYGHQMVSIPAGGSVATAAVGIAYELGARNIILTGQDLAYGEHGTHAGGEISEMPTESRDIFVEGIDGSMVRTRADWEYYLHWFEEQCSIEGLTIIDATEGGAKIHGSRIMTLSDAIGEYCKKEIDFEEILEKIPPTFTDEQYENNVKKDLLHIKKEMRNIRQSSEKGVECCERYLREEETLSEEGKNKLLKEIRKINHFNMLQEFAAPLLDTYTSELSDHELMDMNTITRDIRQDRLNSVEMALAVYKSYIEGADKLMELFGPALEEL